MALIQCRECGADISDQAQSCPKCGCPVNSGYSNYAQNGYNTNQGYYNQQPRYEQSGYNQHSEDKSKIAAGLLAIFLGTIGIHGYDHMPGMRTIRVRSIEKLY